MNGLLTCHIIITVFCVVPVFYLSGTNPALSLGLGSVVALANLLLLGWTWQRILSKKTIALAVGVIVFKYAILGLIIYLVVRDQRVALSWFVGGFSFMVPAILLYALIRQRLSN